MKYLGIDYGKTKIGLALSEGELATAWKVVPISGLEDAIQKINKAITDENIETVVIGRPESGESLKITDAFIAKLKHTEKVQIVEVPETLSSQEARRLMVAMRLPKEKRMEDDAYSAAIILQDFLDSPNLA